MPSLANLELLAPHHDRADKQRRPIVGLLALSQWIKDDARSAAAATADDDLRVLEMHPEPGARLHGRPNM